MIQFTYVLDNPTKTTIWQDSLLYVSQWGQLKNKIARFDLKTGVFLDEFTNVGIPNACGHAWDASGNLLVAQFGNGADGKVLKFDTSGILTSVFIPTTLLQGPVNLWFDEESNLLVADWTEGKVLKFDGASGAYIGPIVSNLANVEGFDFDSQGNLYLCDWSANKVFRYDFGTNTLSPFIQSGGLMAPNSILIQEAISAGSEVNNAAKFRLSITPNPADSFVQVSYILDKPADVTIEIRQISGQKVATLYSGKQMPGEHRVQWNCLLENGARAQPGVYVVTLWVSGVIVSQKVILEG